MLSPISLNTIAQDNLSSAHTATPTKASQPTAAPSAQPEQAATSSSGSASAAGRPQDTVTISNAARQALQESAETSTQTAQEAQRGDLQAQHLLAREAAAKQALKA